MTRCNSKGLVLEKEGEGTRVTHVENYQTKSTLLGWLEEWVTGNWLKEHMQGEMARRVFGPTLKVHANSQSGASLLR